MLPYGGMTRIRFKGFVSLAQAIYRRCQTPSNGVKVLEKQDKSKVDRPFGPCRAASGSGHIKAMSPLLAATSVR